MILLTITEFKKNVSKYLKMALTEKVAIYSKYGVFNISHIPDIITSNPSPSGDPFWNVPENLAHLNQVILEMKTADRSKFYKYTTHEKFREDFGLDDDK